jgi:two-component system sensor histidine kinase QseC
MAAAGRQRPVSLRRRLLLWVMLTTIVSVGLAAALSYRQARDDVQELIDALMAETAQLILSQVSSGENGLGGLPDRLATLHSNEPRSDLPLEFQIGRADGTVLLRTENAPNLPLAAAPGYADIEFSGTGWRSLIVESADRAHLVQLTLPADIRDHEALEIASRMILPLGLMLPLLIGLIYLAVRRGLKPLDDLAADVAARSPENLAALSPTAAPAEAQPLIGALNQLLGRVETTLDNERRFTADAAHELRTPLAALKIHAQVAMAADLPPETRATLEKMQQGVDRTTRLVEQLLRLARLDPIERIAAPQRIDLAGLAAVAVDDAGPAARKSGHALTLRASNDAGAVSGDPDLLGAALRNLIDNALRYTPEGSTVAVAAGCTDGQPVLTVADNGPGVPAGDLPRIAERFYRGSDPGADGSGLGLAIVRRIADLHGARLELDNLPGGGFAARLRWPAGAALDKPGMTH